MGKIRYLHDQPNDVVVMEVSSEGGTVSARFNSVQLDFHLAEMGRLRAAMRQAVPFTAPTSFNADVNPAWSIPGQKQPRGVALALRHSAFGWLGFVFPDNEARNLASWLIKIASQTGVNPQPPSAPQPPPAPKAATSTHREAGQAGRGSGTGSGNANDAGWQGFGSGTGGGGGASGI